MAKAKQQATKTLYHQFFCGEGNLGEADGFFEIKDGKLEWVDGWDGNDANWRGEYMTGLLSWAGVEVKDLPEKYLNEAVKIAEKVWGLDYGSDDESEGEREETELYFREGTSDKVYNLSLYKVHPDDSDSWVVEASYGRRDADLRVEIKGDSMLHDEAKALYDKTLNQKLKKGYKQS